MAQSSRPPDYYRRSLKALGWSWMENHVWHQGKLHKERWISRMVKRAARSKWRKDTVDT